jgi:hypothetical protein
VEHQQIVEDALHHIGKVTTVHLQGIKDIETIVTLCQKSTIRLRELLLIGPRAAQSNLALFLQVEREANPESIICAFHSTDADVVLSNIPHLSTYIRHCVVEADYEKIFEYSDYSIMAQTKSIPIQRGQVFGLSKHRRSRTTPHRLFNLQNGLALRHIVPLQVQSRHHPY